MPADGHSADEMSDLGAVRRALRRELTARGHRVASDTLGLRRELYIVGADDLARALFEFHETADEAVMTMYQGSWTAELPPRFAVLPAREAASTSLELLAQIRATPLLYAADEGVVVFADLDKLLADHLRP